MKGGQSPGLDGIPLELYLEFWSELGSAIFDITETSLQKSFFNRDVNTATISLLCKAAKDPTLCTNSVFIKFRCKIVAKTLPNR